MYIRKPQVLDSAPNSRRWFCTPKCRHKAKKIYKATIFEKRGRRFARLFLIRKRLFAKVALEVANVIQAIVIATFKHGRSGTQLWLFVRQRKKGANIQI